MINNCLTFPLRCSIRQRYHNAFISNELNFFMISGVFKTQSNIQDRAFVEKVNGLNPSLTFIPESSTLFV